MSDKENIEYFKGMTKEQIKTLKEDITEIKADVKAIRKEQHDLENWKNKVIGISIAASIVFSGLLSLVVNYFSKQN